MLCMELQPSATPALTSVGRTSSAIGMRLENPKSNATGQSDDKPRTKPRGIRAKANESSSSTSTGSGVLKLDNLDASLRLKKQQQEKLTQMSLRIKKLEKAIAELTKDNPPDVLAVPQSAVTTSNSDIVHLESSSSSSDNEKDDVMSRFLLDDQDTRDDAFGYSISHLQNDHHMELYGPTGTSEDHMKMYKEIAKRHILITKTNGFQSEENVPSDSYPPQIFFQSLMFPCPPPGQSPLPMEYFLPYIPSYERARALLDNYLFHFSWSCMIATLDDLENLINHFYPSKTKVTDLKLTETRKLSFLWIICLFGTLFDLELNAEEVASQAQLYHLLARATLASYCFSVDTTVEAIQTLVLLVWFYRLCPGNSTSGKERWILSGPILRLIQGIGLDRNSRQYLTDADQCNRFEQLFWEYNAVDIWQSFALGRPTTVSPKLNVCQLPRNVKPLSPFKPEFYIWKYEFSSLLAGITTLGVESPAAYADVLALERQIEKFPTPVSLEWHNVIADDDLPGVGLQRFMTAVFRQLALLYLHRPYFWHATAKHCSQRNALFFSHSVAVVYNSASTIITLTEEVWRMHPKIVERMTPFWRYCQTATSMLGVLIIRNPECPFAKNALTKMENACDILLKAKGSFSPRAEIQDLVNMSKTARETFDKALCAHSNVPESSP